MASVVSVALHRLFLPTLPHGRTGTLAILQAFRARPKTCLAWAGPTTACYQSQPEVKAVIKLLAALAFHTILYVLTQLAITGSSISTNLPTEKNFTLTNWLPITETSGVALTSQINAFLKMLTNPILLVMLK